MDFDDILRPDIIAVLECTHTQGHMGQIVGTMTQRIVLIILK